MKSLASAAILLALIAQVVSATDMCPTGSLEDASVYIDTTDTFFANGCSISYGVTFSIDLPANESITYVTVENSTILSYSLRINIEDSFGPCAIDIKNNLFNLNAYLTVSGFLAMNSSVTIQGNTMSADDNTVNNHINLIYIESLALYANASLNIVNNVLNVSNQNSEYTEPIFLGSISLYPFSSVNILRNTITATGMTQGTLIYIYDLSHAENSTWRVMGNTLTSTSTSTVSAYGAVGVYGDSSAVYVFSNNFVNVTNTDTNTVESVGRALYFQYPSNILLSVDDNQIYYNFENAIYFEDIDRLSGLSISGNAFHSTYGTLNSPVIKADYFNFLPNATYVMSNNSVTATSVTATDAPLVHVGTVSSIYYYIQDNSTKIQYCGNSLPWSNEPTAEQLFSSELLDYVVESCNEVTRPDSSSPLRSLSGSAFVIVISVVVAQLLW